MLQEIGWRPEKGALIAVPFWPVIPFQTGEKGQTAAGIFPVTENRYSTFQGMQGYLVAPQIGSPGHPQGVAPDCLNQGELGPAFFPGGVGNKHPAMLTMPGYRQITGQ
jgi:hypothetical protein